MNRQSAGSAGPKRPRPTASEVRRLGLVFLAAALLLFALAVWKAHAAQAAGAGPYGGPGLGALRHGSGAVRAGAAAAFAVLGILCVTLGARAGAIHRAWSAFGEALGRIVSPLVLAVLYFLVVTPFGLLSRLRRRDPLGLKPDPGAPTYWRAPVSKRTDRKGLLRQY